MVGGPLARDWREAILFLSSLSKWFIFAPTYWRNTYRCGVAILKPAFGAVAAQS
jgi:hypothetical protein